LDSEGKGVEPLGRSVKKTVLWTAFSDGSCDSSSEWFRNAKARRPPPPIILVIRTLERPVFISVQSFIFITLCAIYTKAYFVVKTGWGTESTHHLIPIHFFTRFWAFRRRHIFEKFTIDF